MTACLNHGFGGFSLASGVFLGRFQKAEGEGLLLCFKDACPCPEWAEKGEPCG
jgi:hypothetical protein